MRVALNDWDDRAGLRGYVQFNKYTHTVSLIPPREDQCEWHRMTRMTGPDCVVMCNLINTHTHTHTHTNPERSSKAPVWLAAIPNSKFVTDVALHFLSMEVKPGGLFNMVQYRTFLGIQGAAQRCPPFLPRSDPAVEVALGQHQRTPGR